MLTYLFTRIGTKLKHSKRIHMAHGVAHAAQGWMKGVGGFRGCCPHHPVMCAPLVSCLVL